MSLPLFFCSFLFGLSPLFAQKATQVQTKVNLVAWGNSVPGLTLKAPSGKTTKALSFSYNESLSYSGPRILAIYQIETDEPAPTDEDDEDEPVEETRPIRPDKKIDISKSSNPLVKALFERREKEPELVSLVELPADSRHVTVLLAPASEGTFQPYVIDDDPRKLPKGKLRVHNLSAIPVRIEQIRGKQRCQLEPRDKFVFNSDERNRFIYRVSYKSGEKWKVQTNNSIRVPENEQTQLVVLKSESQFFVSSDGSQQGFLQFALLRRKAE